jgi:hypothetical protein
MGAAELRGTPLGVDSNNGLGSIPGRPLCTPPYKGCLSLYKSAGPLLRNLRWQQLSTGTTLLDVQSRYWPDQSLGGKRCLR